MPFERKKLNIFKTSDLTTPVTALAVGDQWVSEPIQCLGCDSLLAILESTDGNGTTKGVTTLVGQFAVDRAITVPIAQATSAGAIQTIVPGTPCFLAGGQAATWIGGTSSTACHGIPWPFFRLSGTADATNGACVAPVLNITKVTR